MFETTTEVEQANETASQESVGGDDEEPTASGYVFTSSSDLSAMRTRIVAALDKRFGAAFVRRRQTLYETADSSKRACISLSKRYDRDYQPYWYAFHPAWGEFLGGADEAVHVLGCMDRDVAYAIPYSVLRDFLPKLNQTTRDGKMYWHVVLTLDENGALALYSSRNGDRLSVEPYALQV